MSQELNKVLRYGFSNIKKFEWANCYQLARPYAMEVSNIASAWSGAGLISFNPQKVIRRIKAESAEKEIAQLTISTLPLSPRSSKFDLVPNTLSKLDSTILRSANEALLHNIQAEFSIH